MLNSPKRLFLAGLVLAAGSVFAAPQWEEMDYGRFISATFNNAEGKPTFEKRGLAANKGIAVRLGKEGNATMLFDTDLLRMAGGWTGGFFKTTGVAFDTKHGPNPKPAEGSEIVFQTHPTGPGWSKAGKLDDPRELPTGPGAATVPFGPVPADWAKYKGLYLHGDNVVFAYTVGAAPVLEAPGIETVAEQKFLTRTLNILGKGAATSMVLADLAEGAAAEVKDGAVIARADAAKPDARLVISAAGLPAGAQFEIIGGNRIALKLPALAGTEVFKVAYWKGLEADLPKAAAAKLAKAADLKPWTRGGPAHWTEEVTVAGTLAEAAEENPYVVDTITLPVPNPYKSWMRIAALDFFKDGALAVSHLERRRLDRERHRREAGEHHVEPLRHRPLPTARAEDRRRPNLRARPRPDHSPPRPEQRRRGRPLRELQQRRAGHARLPRVRLRSADRSAGQLLLRQRRPGESRRPRLGPAQRPQRLHLQGLEGRRRNSRSSPPACARRTASASAPTAK